jgi:anti-sigma factor RsiW
MMTCRDCIELLADFVDGSMAAGHRPTFEEHLAGCAHCASYFYSYKLIIEWSARLDTKPLPAQCRQRLEVRVAQQIAAIRSAESAAG